MNEKQEMILEEYKDLAILGVLWHRRGSGEVVRRGF